MYYAIKFYSPTSNGSIQKTIDKKEWKNSCIEGLYAWSYKKDRDEHLDQHVIAISDSCAKSAKKVLFVAVDIERI